MAGTNLWAAIAQTLAGQIASALGGHALGIEHIGSTAVPDLLAKPIIDLTVGVQAQPDVPAIERSLTGIDWIYRGDAGSDGGHVFVLERRPSVRIAHLHVVEHLGEQWCRYLALRSRLRADESARSAYERTKLALIDEHGADNGRREYTIGKTSIVNELLTD